MKENDRYKEAIRGLENAVKNFSWLGEFFGSCGAISLHKMLCCRMMRHNGDKAGFLGALSSTYYAAAGNAASRMKRSALLQTKLLWFVRAVTCLLYAWRLSNRFKKAKGGLEKMSGEELDIRNHILRRLAEHLGYVEWLMDLVSESRKCTEEGLNRAGLSVNTRALLLMDQAASVALEGHFEQAEHLYNRLVRNLPSPIEVSTKVRVARSYAVFLRRVGKHNSAKEWEKHALYFAEKGGLRDQIGKIAAD